MNGTKHATEAADFQDGGLRAEVGGVFFWFPRSILRLGSGRRALQSPAKGNGQRSLEVLQVIMPERVTIKRVRIPFAESLRFPGEGKSAQG